MSSPNDIIGNMPFILNNKLYPWSGLLPARVKLLLFVIPESPFYVEKPLITKPPPQQGPIQTFFLPHNLRASKPLHRFLSYFEEKIETQVKDYGGFLLPPDKEICGGNTEGRLPEWIPVEKTDHLLCQIGEMLNIVFKGV